MQTHLEGHILSPEIIADMRHWLADSPFSGLDLDEAAELDADNVALAVDWEYPGGIGAFLEDGKI